MGERWMNAVIEVTVPLEVAPDAPDEAKLAAAVARLEELDLPGDAVATVRWVLVEDREPLTLG
jgi:hypothetical protein